MYAYNILLLGQKYRIHPKPTYFLHTFIDVANILVSMCMQSNPDLKIELACLMEENIHSLLADIVMDAATEAIDTVMSKSKVSVLC